MDLEFDYPGSDREWYLNYDNILKSETTSPTIRLLAATLQKTPYLTVGDWLMSLGERSFQEIFELAEESEDNEHCYETEQLLLLTLMLSHAEGTNLPNDDMEGMNRQLMTMRQLIIITSLGRKGLVRCYYENFSLGEDMLDKPIVERL